MPRLPVSSVLMEVSMKRILSIFILFVVLTGCASTRMNRGLQELSGKDIKTAFSVLGYPNEEKPYGEEIVYIWNKRSQIIYPGTGLYDGKKRVVSSVNNNCTIRIVSDSRGIIKHWKWSGREQGCQSYARKLHNYYKQFE